MCVCVGGGVKMFVDRITYVKLFGQAWHYMTLPHSYLALRSLLSNNDIDSTWSKWHSEDDFGTVAPVSYTHLNKMQCYITKAKVI